MLPAKNLIQSAQDVLNERAKERDVEQERSMEKIVKMFNVLHDRDLTEVEGWSFMQMLKTVRCHVGPFKADDYIDRISYAALEGECRSKD